MKYSSIKLKSLFICLILIETAILHVLFYGPASPLVPEPAVGINTFFTYSDVTNPGTRINIQKIGNTPTMVLPSSMSPESVPIYSTLSALSYIRIEDCNGNVRHVKKGECLNLNEICNKEDYKLKFFVNSRFKKHSYEFKIIFSENLPSMYITSDDPVYQGRHFVEVSYEKANKTTGSLVMQDNNGEVYYSGKLSQIKGRGNSTWSFAKRPYQIKLENSADLLNSGNKENKDKTWILLANYIDQTLMHNAIASNIGKNLGAETEIEGMYTDLYYDGIYRGTYVISEKVEVAKGRVEITDLDKANEKLNDPVKAKDLPIATETTPEGIRFTYVHTLKSPENITGGYMLEMDYEERAVTEPCYFVTKRGQHIVVKSPEYATKEEMKYISSLYQNFEDAVYAGGTNPATGKHYSEYADAKSIARYYLLHEFSKARDCFKSSAYFHIDAHDNKLHMGPLWDYDLSFGNGGDIYTVADSPVGFLGMSNRFASTLLKTDDFYGIVRKMYAEELYPMVNAIITDNSDNENSVLSIPELYQYLAPSVYCDSKIWFPYRDYDSEVNNLCNFISKRAEYLKEFFETFQSIENIPEGYLIDVLSGSSYYEDVLKCHSLGIMEDVGNHMFLPETYVKRAHTVKVLHNLAGFEEPLFKTYFSDVSLDDWYSYALAWAYGKGLVSGYSDGCFKPENNVTIEDISIMFYRLAGSPETDTTVLMKYKDFGSIPISSKDAVAFMLNEGLLDVTEDSIKSHKYITRAELASIALRYYEKFNLAA